MQGGCREQVGFVLDISVERGCAVVVEDLALGLGLVIKLC